MNRHSGETLEAYYAEAASWNRDRVQSVRRSHRIAWGIATAAVTVAVLEGLALVLLTPLKSVEPYTLMVDRTTGYVQALKPLEQSTVAPDSALTQSFLVQYVIGREGFDTATLNTSYRKVALFSADSARTGYLSAMQVSNPESPLVRYPRSTIIDARVKSVSPIGPNTALVRFDTVRSDASGGTQPPRPWVAVLRYRYSTAPMSVADRFINPLGFQVTSYRKDAEALAPDAMPAPVSGTAAQPAPAGHSLYYSPPEMPPGGGRR